MSKQTIKLPKKDTGQKLRDYQEKKYGPINWENCTLLSTQKKVVVSNTLVG